MSLELPSLLRTTLVNYAHFVLRVLAILALLALLKWSGYFDSSDIGLLRLILAVR